LPLSSAKHHGEMISTKNLTHLPEPQQLRNVVQSLAMLDAILEPRLSQRSFFFLNHWSISDSIGTLRMHDDHLYSAFGQSGAFLKGYVKQCPMAVDGRNWPGIDTGLPQPFLEWKLNPYFEFEQTTFCIWRMAGDAVWRCGNQEPPLGDNPDGSAKLLQYLDGNPETYADWASARKGEPVDVDAVSYLFDRRPITESILRVLNPELEYRALAHDLRSTGYPLRGPL
jgi:hypothetical protein